MSAATFLADLAARLLPDHRRSWGEAMRHETAAIADPVEATRFAAGCLWAALSVRITVMKAFVFSGRLCVGAVTALYGLSFLYFLTNGVLHGVSFNLPPEVLPWLLAWQAAMGISHLAAAGLLVFWRPRAFLIACAATALPALALTGFGIVGMMAGKVRPDYPIIAFAWPLVPLALLMGAAWLFAWLEREPKQLAHA